MDREVNRRRVAEYRNRRYSEGRKSFTVYLKPAIVEKVRYLRRMYQMKTRGSEVIEMAIETLYQKTLRKRNRNG